MQTIAAFSAVRAENPIIYLRVLSLSPLHSPWMIIYERSASDSAHSRRPSSSSSPLIIKHREKKSEPLRPIVAFDQRHRYKFRVPFMVHFEPRAYRKDMPCEVCMINHWFFWSLQSLFNDCPPTWRKSEGKKTKTTTVHFVIMVMATAVCSTWIFN